MVKRNKSFKSIAIGTLTAFCLSCSAPTVEAAGAGEILGAGVIIALLAKQMGSSKTQKQKAENKKMVLKFVDTWAQQGEVEAQFVVGCMYYHGIERKEDKELGRMWLRMAAGRGHVEAQEYVKLIDADEPLPSMKFSDLCYMAGKDAFNGVSAPADGKLAAKWLQVACDSGDKKSYGLLGTVYMLGWAGAEQNEKLAVNIFYEGIKKHDGLAYYQLGKMFMRGQGGLQKDLSMAANLFIEASKKGIKDADNQLFNIMTDDEEMMKMMLANEGLDPNANTEKKK